ncbi:MAG: hypothetical protein AB8G86_09145 [Saprospiraceae bacterium]
MLRNIRKTGLFLPYLLFFALFVGCQSQVETEKTDKAVADGEVKIEMNKLLGKWQSVNNPKTVIELTNDRMYAYHGDLKLSDESLVIYQNCVSRCVPEGVAQMPCMVTDGKRAENCFEVLELTDKSLSYALISGDRKIFKFQKM